LIKSNQKSSRQRCFFALKAFALQNGQNLGRDYFALTLISPAAKTPMPYSRTAPHCFARFRPKLFCRQFGEPKSFGDLEKHCTCHRTAPHCFARFRPKLFCRQFGEPKSFGDLEKHCTCHRTAQHCFARFRPKLFCRHFWKVKGFGELEKHCTCHRNAWRQNTNVIKLRKNTGRNNIE
jgi:hypothetical protein